jgi:hypothetical protein
LIYLIASRLACPIGLPFEAAGPVEGVLIPILRVWPCFSAGVVAQPVKIGNAINIIIKHVIRDTIDIFLVI